MTQRLTHSPPTARLALKRVRLTSDLEAEAADIRTPPERLAELAKRGFAWIVAGNPAAPLATLEMLSDSADRTVRRALANNPATSATTLRALAAQFPEQFLQNPALELLILENPNFFKELPDSASVALVECEACPDWVLAQVALVEDETLQRMACDHPNTPPATLRAGGAGDPGEPSARSLTGDKRWT
ncbi:MAG TPA: hypothetical protein PLS42_09165 [Candidatus Competibacter denitrificans]|nr:hypothetical protein [Candidatus Competibacteraceae bacterium]HRC69819.1 hypothetical protein [Candidatus Competibacter denitrificans]